MKLANRWWSITIKNEIKEGDDRFFVRAIWAQRSYFSPFPDYQAFIDYIEGPFKEVCGNEKTFTDKCTFFEIIPGFRSQKPYFDIDIDPETVSPEIPLETFEKELLEELVTAVLAVIKEAGYHSVSANDLILTTSSGEKKKSYHLIVNGYRVANNYQNRTFYKKVIARVPERFRPFIDAKLYSSLQNFRLLGSQKEWSDRFKRIIPLVYQGVEYPTLGSNWREQLPQTLIGSPFGEVIHFEDAEDPQKSSDYREELDKEDLQKAMQLLQKKLNIRYEDNRFPFRYKNVVDCFIVLQRTRAFKCPVCNRTHDHQHPYMFINTMLNGDRTVYFDCRRNAENKKWNLGVIDNLYQEWADKIVEKIVDETSPEYTEEKKEADKIWVEDVEKQDKIQARWNVKKLSSKAVDQIEWVSPGFDD